MNPDNLRPPVLDRALDLVRFLRDRCDWDARQTPESLVPYLLEEAHETADAIADGDAGALAGELGDLLLNVAFQIVIAEERGHFSATDVVQRLETKMRRRHPHLYGDGPREDWEQLKARERGESTTDRSILAGVPRDLDPLSRAQRIQDRVSAVGFDWADHMGALEKVEEEVAEVRAAIQGRIDAEIEEELGDLLFAVVNLTRLLGAHARMAMQRSNTKFTRRFTALEALATERGIVLGHASLEELDVLWDDIKTRE
jgi:nucleoside triphosphate diphosphatase